jgi:hypothetical protein
MMMDHASTQIYTELYMSNGPGRAGTRGTSPSPARFSVVPGRPPQLRPSTVILIRAVPSRRHNGPVVPGRAQTRKHKKHSKIQNLRIIFKFSLDSINYIYNFRYILRQRILDTHINTYNNSKYSYIITYYQYYS